MIKKIGIIVLSFNGGDELQKCLESLVKIITPTGWEAELIIVDNNSEDGSVQKAIRSFPKETFILNPENLGFAGGCNVGIKYCQKHKKDSVLLINQDTEVPDDFLIPLLEQLYSDKQVGLVGPVINFVNQSKTMYDHGATTHKYLKKSVHINRRSVELLDPTQRDFITGCCLLVKMEVFEKIGLLDEQYFLYFEDDDFCLRARRGGYSIWVVPQSQIFHYLSSANVASSPKVIYYNTRNFLYFLKKNFSGDVLLPYIIWSAFKAGFWMLTKPKIGKATMKGIFDYLSGTMGSGSIV
jgi:GT2 family glycosyltransferase